MTLRETVEMMLSGDYKERFIAEYVQLKIRYEKLKAYNNRIEAANATRSCYPIVALVEEPPHDCPAEMLREQQQVMGNLLHLLEIRAVIEKIDISEVTV